MSLENHEFRGGQVFKRNQTETKVKLLLAGNGWCLDGIPNWNIHHELNPPGGMLHHGNQGEFHFTHEKLKEFLEDWEFIGWFHELYDLQGVEENKYKKSLFDTIQIGGSIEDVLENL